MGGKALKTVKTRRYKLKEYIESSNFIINKIKDILYGISEVSDIAYLKNKRTFGDLDILISFDEKNSPFIISQMIVEAFSPDEYLRNGRSFSFNVKDLQVDLIFTPIECFDLSITYYQNNDAGMLIGRMAHSIGLKYGPEYLRLVVYENSIKLCDIKLTNDPKRIFNVLDLDHDRFIKGFNNYNELFEFLTMSKLFCYDVFSSKLVNSESRRRDNKRKSLHIFNKWLTLNQERFPSTTDKFTMDDKIGYINTLFPEIGILDIIANAKRNLETKKKVSDKWNGSIIQKLFPDLNGKGLGIAINKFKTHIEEKYPSVGYDNYILMSYFKDIVHDFKTVAFNYEIR